MDATALYYTLSTIAQTLAGALAVLVAYGTVLLGVSCLWLYWRLIATMVYRASD